MSAVRGAANKLYYLPKPTRWTTGIGAALPEEYKKFWKEWKLTTPAPVHYIPKEGKYEKKADGTIVPIQNVPIPLTYPKELDQGIWGGEAVVQGFLKKHKYNRRIVRYWVPSLKKTIVHSEILDKYLRTIVTDRTISLIHENYGFDHYILKTPACDLRSLLAVQLKREMLKNLADKTLYPDNPVKKDEVYNKYKHYLESYTRAEIEWYGLSWKDACKKYLDQQYAEYNPIPLKVQFRKEFIDQLKGDKKETNNVEESKSWLSKINPFGGKTTDTTS